MQGPLHFRNVIGGVAGLTADANSLVNFARTAAQRHLLRYDEDIPRTKTLRYESRLYTVRWYDIAQFAAPCHHSLCIS
jgi:20S proteasome alpha/beta subunit